MTQQNLLLNAALAYLDDLRTVIPLNGKIPVIPSWKEFQEGDAPTAEQMKQWFEEYPNITGLGMVTGYIHGLAVLDLEADENPSRFELPPTAVSRTGGGGWHYFYDYPEGTDFIKSGPLSEYHIHGDMKADGGYVVVPPSIHPRTGKAYEWVTPLELETELPRMPEWLFQIEKERQSKDIEGVDWSTVLAGTTEGNRHDTAVKLAGKLIHHLPGKDWYEVGLPLLLAWNATANEPPLPEKEIVSIFKGIAQKQYSQGDDGTTYEEKVPVARVTKRELLSVSTILNMPESERPKFLVYGLIPKAGITAMSGHPGCGKSWIMLHLAKCVATGEAFLDNMRTEAGNVLIVDEESGVWEMRRRMELLGYSTELPIFFHCQDSFKVDDENDMKVLLDTVVKQDIKLVIFDPFVAIHSQDENSAEGAQKVMEALQKFNALGVTVLFIHHHRKGAASGGQSLRGSSAFSGRLDSHITVEKQDDMQLTQVMEIEHVKSRRGQNVKNFRVILTQGAEIGDPVALKYETSEDRASKKEQASDVILEALAGGDLFKDEIKEATKNKADVGSRNTEEALLQLTHQKKISCYKEDSKNKYHLEVIPEVPEGEKPF